MVTSINAQSLIDEDMQQEGYDDSPESKMYNSCQSYDLVT